MLTTDPRQLLQLSEEHRTRLYHQAQVEYLAELAQSPGPFYYFRRRIGRALVWVGMWLQKEQLPLRRAHSA